MDREDHNPERSPVSPLFRSNAVPDEEQILLINKILREHQDELNQIQAGKGAASQRKACHKYIAAHKALLNPIRRIPPELLQEIFLQYFYAFIFTHDASTSASFQNQPWEISQVCSSWRAAALALPILWSQIPPIEVNSSTKKSGYYRGRLQFLLERSRPAPLTLSISGIFKDWDSHPIISLLASYSPRWGNISIYASLITIGAFWNIENNLPLLHTLDLQVRSSYKTGDGLSLFWNAPKLRSVTLQRDPTHQFELPWSQLTTYREIAPLITTDALTRVAQAHALQRLDLLWVDELPSQIAEDRLVDIRLDNLVSLTFGVDAPRLSIIDHFTLPALRELTILFYGGEIVRPLISLIHRSTTAAPDHLLRKLYLRYMRNSSDPAQLARNLDLRQLFSLTPELEELQIDADSESRLACLVVAPNTSPLLPRLRSLTLHVISSLESSDLITSIIETRKSPSLNNQLSESSPSHVTTLKTARIRFFVVQEAHQSHIALNRLYEPPNTTHTTGQEADFIAWTQRMIDELSELNSWRLMFQRDDLDPPDLVGLDEILRFLENIDLERARTELCTSFLPKLLYRLNDTLEDDISYDDILQHSFPHRISAILAKWRPVLKEYASTVHWVHEGLGSIIYMPPSYESRRPESLQYCGDITFGLPRYQEVERDRLIATVMQYGFPEELSSDY